jgi:hypothetical protein
MSTIIKAIETRYKNYRFRSRLEARWAVFFDALGIAWEYEKEGYDLGDAGWYLPDFWLPQVNMWAEVKAQLFTPQEIGKCNALLIATHYEVVLLDGIPDFRSYFVASGPPWESEHEYMNNKGHIHLANEWQGCTLPVEWFPVPWSDVIVSNGYLDENRFYSNTGAQGRYPIPMRWSSGEHTGAHDNPVQYAAAYAAARSARFEHGESGVNQ